MSSKLAVDLAPMARLFKALSDETRLRMVALLTQGEMCVCHFQEILDLPQPHISRHLAILRAAKVVDTRREGSWIHYSISEQDDPECARQLESLCEQFADRKLLKRDRARLVTLRGRRDCN
jgi:ArsR family transcriptional regulator